jgi:tetrahydromethanopterin S-methyltransferase subunit F
MFKLLTAYSNARIDGLQCGQLVADIMIIPQKKIIEIAAYIHNQL